MRATLLEVRPSVTRSLEVPAACNLAEFHDLLQAGFGWTDSHLHQFVVGETRYGMLAMDAPEDELDETAVPLSSLPDHFSYLYDYGDGWEHEIEVLGSGSGRPRCLAGDGACPPEDCGGPGGYAEFREALADSRHPEHRAMLAWAGGWRDEFDRAATDLLIRQTAGVVPAPVRFLLELAADGVKLTPGGRLPRAVVRKVQERYPAWAFSESPASLEDDLPPLAALHRSLRSVGLLRLRERVLRPTRAAGDEMAIIRRLRSWFGPRGAFNSVLAGHALASLAAEGPCSAAALAARVFPRLGHRWVTGAGDALTEEETRLSLYALHPVLVGMDLVEDVAVDRWSAGQSARWLLPRATALANLLGSGSPL